MATFIAVAVLATVIVVATWINESSAAKDRERRRENRRLARAADRYDQEKYRS